MSIFNKKHLNPVDSAFILVQNTLKCINYGGEMRNQYYENFFRLMDLYKHTPIKFFEGVEVLTCIEKAHEKYFPKLDKEEVCEYVTYTLKEDLEGVLPSGSGDLNIVCGFVNELLVELEKIK